MLVEGNQQENHNFAVSQRKTPQLVDFEVFWEDNFQGVYWASPCFSTLFLAFARISMVLSRFFLVEEALLEGCAM